MSRPVIGVTGPTRGGVPAWTLTWLAVRRAGGRAVRITTASTVDRTRLDGLLIGGGSDVSPERYGEAVMEIGSDAPSASWRDRIWGAALFLFRLLFSAGRRAPRIDTARDALEMDLCRDALARKIPILGICRGAQLINVTLGGSLHQDIRGFYVETPRMKTVRPRKEIRIEPDTVLRQILGIERLRVNSLHDQAVNDLGENLRVAATEHNSVIQAIEHTKRPFVLGVQWHPEYLPQLRRHQLIFQALVQAARDRPL